MSQASGVFVSLNLDYEKDIWCMTLAQWISELVTLAYKKLGLMIPSHCTHEVRAWSTSLVLSHSIPLSAILDMAFWHLKSTFIIFYL